MKPVRILGFFLFVLFLLLGSAWFVPDGRLPLTENLEVRFPDSRKLYQENRDKLHALLGKEEAVSPLLDTTYQLDTLRLTPQITDSFPSLILPDSAYLKSFFSRLTDSGEAVHLLHFGDSQIEGDRLTAWLRLWLQEAYGGFGPGWFSAGMPVAYTRSLDIRISDGWQRFHHRHLDTVYRSHLRPGLDMSVDVLQGNDSRWLDDDIRIRKSRYADSLAARWENLSMYYGRNTDTVYCRAELNDTAYAFVLPPADGPAKVTLRLPPTAEVKWHFRYRGRIEVYGFSLDSHTGVIIDNLPSRGSAGLEFTPAERPHLDSLLALRSPDLLLLQYGLNVVLHITDDYRYYEEGLYRQIRRLQSFLPEVPIVLLTLGDVHLEDSLPQGDHILLISQAQQRAARRAGVATWDSREAMGGAGATELWQQHKPAWLTPDGAHLTYTGSGELARRFYLALLREAPPVLKVDTAAIFVDTLNYEAMANYGHQGAGAPAGWMRYRSGNPYLFTAPAFWLFFFVLLLSYSLVYRKPALRNAWLFLFSLFFYYRSGGWFFGLLLVSTLTDYSVGWLLHYSRRRFWRKMWVVLSLLINLGMLGYYKYAYFFTDLINESFGSAWPVKDWLALAVNQHAGTDFDVSTIALPVGISFFTFQTLSYTLDVYRRKIQPVKNILDFGFYVSFFPQLVAGPIVRASEFIPQLYRKYRLRKTEFSHALFLILTGLLKKMVISDFLATQFVDKVFHAPYLYTGLENLLASYGYGLQIYCDFSGYTDIAIGLALFLGFRLPVNFNAPYKALGVQDFWRRWHISLSRWLKDYLYIPLGGNRKGRMRTGVNLLITMLLGGLWHGAHYRFVIWGGLHGLALLVQRVFRKSGPRPPARGWKRFLTVFLTFHFITLTWMFFRAEDLQHVQLMLEQIFFRFEGGYLLQVAAAYPVVLALLVLGYIMHWLPERIKENARGSFIKRHWLIQALICVLVILLILQFQEAGLRPFIYFRF